MTSRKRTLENAEYEGFKAGSENFPCVPVGPEREAWESGWESGKRFFDRSLQIKAFPALGDLDFWLSNIERALSSPRDFGAAENARISIARLKNWAERLILKDAE